MEDADKEKCYQNVTYYWPWNCDKQQFIKIVWQYTFEQLMMRLWSGPSSYAIRMYRYALLEKQVALQRM
jgi:hypothetical protein